MYSFIHVVYSVLKVKVAYDDSVSFTFAMFEPAYFCYIYFFVLCIRFSNKINKLLLLLFEKSWKKFSWKHNDFDSILLKYMKIFA